MTCDRIRPLLSGYHDDVLSLEDRARVRAHVEECAACRAVLRAYEDMYAALRSAAPAVPPELRRNVYTRLAALEAQRTGTLPFGPALLGMLRTAGGTAGLLAVLAALVAAAVRLTSLQPTTGGATLGAAPSDAVAATVVSGMVNPAHKNTMPLLPPVAQTVVAPLRHRPARVWRLHAAKSGDKSHVLVDVDLVLLKAHSGAPDATVRMHLELATTSTPVVKNISMGTPSPVPTIPAGDGVVYLHLDTPAPFLNRGNSRAEVEWHSFAPGSTPVVLVTPGPDTQQLFTGINSSLDGRTIALSAMGLGKYGGIFRFTLNDPHPQQVFAWSDRSPPSVGYAHRYVKQVYFGRDGRLFFSLVDSLVNTVTVSVAMTTPTGLDTLAQTDWPASNYVLSPDRSRIAWTHHPYHEYGFLQVAALGTKPLTATISTGGAHLLTSHPLWSPDGASLLFLGSPHPRTYQPGLYLWSAGRVRRLVQPNPGGHQFITNFAWAPGGRFFVYLLTTMGARGTTEVWLGDTQTGITWKSFTRRWIGTIAWVHGPANVVTVPAGATPSPTPTAPVPPTPTTPAPPMATPTPYDVTSGPVELLKSYYNAVNRRDFRRAYNYWLALSNTQSLSDFTLGYGDTMVVTVTRLLPAPYLQATNYHAATCVGLALVALHRDGRQVRYGGWYQVESTTGQNPRFGGWRLSPSGTFIRLGKPAVVPAQSACSPAPQHFARPSAPGRPDAKAS